jgi:hypothetical protein
MKTERLSCIGQVAQLKQTSNRFVLLSFLFVMSFIVLFLTSLPATLYGSSEPVAAIAEKQYDFGEVANGSEVAHDFLITNRGAGLLTISDVKTG